MIPADAWPAGDLVLWGDDATRTHHDFLHGTTRPYTAEENAEADERAVESREQENERTLIARATTALAANRDFLAIATPSNAQTLAQVRALTRQMNAALRLLVGDLTGTD